MNRRKALTVAGATVASLSAATAAFAVNLGLLGSPAATVPGDLEADQAIAAVHDLVDPTTTSAPATVPTTTTLEPEVVVRYEDVYVQAPAESARVPAAPVTTATPSPAPAPALAPAPAPAATSPSTG